MSRIAGGQVLDRGIALVELGGLVDPVDERLRHRLAGLIMAREPVQHLARQQPLLVHLRGILHEIARGHRQPGYVMSCSIA
jgi:hypothetical protein